MPEYRSVTLCFECKHFRTFPDGSSTIYGTCTRHKTAPVQKTNDFCSYAEPKTPPLPEYDDHTVSGLLEE